MYLVALCLRPLLTLSLLCEHLTSLCGCHCPRRFFPARWKQENSTQMYRGQDTAAPHALATDTDDELRAGIAVAKRLGMRTSLSPML